MADYTIVEEALKRGYTMDEIADNLARDNGVDPADARGRGYTTGEMMKNLGYVKPETSDVARGFVTSFKQLPQLGYGLLAGAGAVAESVAGEGGVSTSMKNFGVKKYQEAGADIEKDSKQSDSLSYSWEQAKQGDFGSLVDWLQYGIGYGGGQAVQALATAGVGSLVGKTVLKGTAENLASKMVAKEALRLGATEEAKRLTAQEISKIAVANVASNIGQTVAIGSQAFGMEGGEIFGDLAQKTVKEGRAATGGELAKAFGATAAAGALEFVGDKLGVDVMLGKSKMFKPASSMTGVGGRAARAAVAVPGTVLAEGGTEYLQTGIEEYGKGNEKNFLPFMQSESAQKQALDAAGLGAVGGGGMAMVGGAFSSPQKKDAAPSPSPSISSAQTADDAIAAFQDEVASVTPRGSFGNMDELAGFIEAERSDIGKRRGLLAQQQQDARDMENEFNGLVKDEQIDQSYRLNDAQRQRDAERARDGGYDLALQQREEQQGRTVEQLAAASEAQGFGNEEPTAMQLAMQRAQQKALDNEFSGLLKQERASLNEMRANVKRVAGVPVEQISTPQLEEIAQSEAHPNTKMAAVAALNDRHDAIQQDRERLMQLREARLERQADQSVQGEQPGAVPDADNQANVKALTENAAKRQATQLTNQGYPTVAYPHPTQSGMWAIGLAEEAKTANLTQNDAPSRPSASWDEQPAIEVKQPIPRKKPSPDNIAHAIINMGGVSTSLKNDILGDAATRTRPGLFTSNGTTDLGALASRLFGEFGFSQINLNDATDNSGAKQLSDLIARAVNGESILNEEAMIRAQEAEEVARHQDDINRKAEELGIKPSGRGRPFSKVEAEVLKLMEIRLNKEIEEAGTNLEEARAIALRDLSEEQLAEIQDKARDALGENPSILETYRALAAGIKEAVNENERNKKADTEGSRSGIEVAGAGHAEEASRPATSGTAREGQSAEAEVAPEFGLVGQAEEEAIAEEQARHDAEAKRQREEQDAENKRQADAERDSFNLSGSTLPADELAARGQEGLFEQKSDPIAAVKATLDAAGVTGTDRTTTIAAVRRGDLTPEDVAEAHQPKPAAGPTPLHPDAEFIAKANADFESALSDLGDIVGKRFRHNFTPEQEQKIIPVLTRLFDAAFRKGYYTFKDAARFVLDTIKAKFGGDIEEQITLDHLQGAYIGMAGRYRDQGADSARVVVAVENKKELEVVHGNDQHRGSNLERDSQDANVADGMGEEGVRNERGGNRGGRGSGIQDSQGEGGSRGGVSVSGREAVSSGERGDLEIYTGAPGVPASTAGNGVSVGSDSDSFNGSPIESDSASVIEEVAESGLSVEKAKLTQLQADKKEHAPGLNNIRETLPILTEGQQEDVYIAETRFAKPDGYGMLFTNGTGTGKTFTGLGVIKRFVAKGKDNIIVVVPNDKILSDWQKAGKLLGLNISQLANTQSAGSGVVITTYANFGQNNQLAHRNWDLIVHDEAHYLKMDAKGSDTLALKALQAISLHPDGAHVRHSMLYADDIAKMADIQARLKDNSPTASEMAAIDVENDRLVDALNAARKRHTETVQAVRDDVAARQGEARPRALFLSATPFAYEKAVDWANGYLFDYNEGMPQDGASGTGGRGYNSGSNRERFFMQHFGYRMRYNKLTQPDAKVDSGLMQRQFNSWLKKSGVLSGRMLDVKADYDRRFVLVESAIGQRIDEALQWFDDQSKSGNKNPGLRDLRGAIAENFSYLQRRYLLEAIKAKEVIPHVKEHLALGRKVVVFHDYKKGGGFNPFNVMHKSGDGTAEYNAAVDMFRAEFKDLIASPVWQSSSPIATFQQEFPGVLLFNGDVPSKQRRANVEKFQDDASGPQVILVQSAAGKEGISLHDTTGKHQRVLFNLGQPTQPTTAMQQEGRIYRTGQKSDAIFRYLNTGTNWEKWAFATTIAQRASAAENLGMGEQARALKDAFIAGFEESDNYRAGMENEGKGGKERDKAANNALTEYDRAKAFYFGTQKKNSRTKAQEGTDYFATPEPVGLKMMELADIRPGESVLEPSAGHGAIARWAPDTAEKTAIEPSMTLRPRLAMVFDGKILGQTFEDLHVSNKYDAIVMNPPFGSGGRTAIDHLAKAATHLREGGRIVALIPTGPSADAKFDKWFYEESEKPVKPLFTHPDFGPIFRGDTVTFDAFGAKHDMAVWGIHDTGGAQYAYPKGADLSSAINLIAAKSIKPTGKRTESFSPSKGINLVANIDLPQVTFERAGTKVATRIVVLEKNENAPQQTNRDYSNATDIGDLFDRMENLSIPGRAKPVEAERNVAVTGGRKSVIEKANADAKAAEEKAQEAGAIAADASEATFTLSGDKIVTNAPATEYTTKAGKKLDGVLVPDEKMAKAVDQFTWKIRGEGKWFVRLRHIERPGVAMFNAKSGSIGNPIDAAALESTIASVIAASPSQWGRDTVVTATLFSELPAPIVEKAKAEGYDAHGRNRDGQKLTGATYDGKVYLVQENITSEIEAEETLLHERIHQILHGNAEDENGKALRQSLGRLYSRIGGKDAIVALAKRIGADMSGPLAALPKVAVRNRPAFLVDEFLAHVEGQRAYEKFPQSVVRAIREFYGEFRDWLRSSKFVKIADAVGVNIGTFTQSDLSWTLKKIRQQQAGTGSKAIRFMTAWHGSPHDHDGLRTPFDRVDDSPEIKSLSDGIVADAKLLADFAHTESFIKKGFRGFDVPAQLAQLRRVIRLVEHDKIRQVVVQSIPVDMMDMLIGRQLTPEMLLHDVSVFRNLLSVDSNNPVSLPIDVSSRLANVVAIAAAKVANLTASDVARAALKGDAAMVANKGSAFSPALNRAVNFDGSIGSLVGNAEASSADAANNIFHDLPQVKDGDVIPNDERIVNSGIFDDADVKITAKESRRASNETAPANAGVSVSAPSESVRRIQAVVERFKSQFKGASALDIRVVSTTFDIPARFRPSPFAEGVFHDDAGLVYLVTMNLRNPRGVLSENRAWQVLLHESVGHYGLSQMMGDKFAGILKAVKQATNTKGRITEDTRDTFEPGDQDYATWDAVKLRYPDATDAELAQEVLARMSETDPGSSVLGYAVAVVRQWVRDVARAMGVNVVVSTSELRDLVAKASGYMRRGDNLAEERVPSGLVAASQKVGAGETAFSPFRAVDTESESFKKLSRLLGSASIPGGVEPNLYQAVVDGLKGNAEAIANLLESRPFLSHGYRGLNIPAKRMVVKHVLGVSQNDEVVRRVIASVPVDMMNLLVGKELSAKSLLRDEAMLKDVLAVDGKPLVSLGVNVSDAVGTLMREVARAATEVASGLTDRALENNSAYTAGLGDSVLGRHSEPRNLSGFANYKAVDTTSASFLKWFGDSKVVDADGNPLRVYHGTDADLTEFKRVDSRTGHPSAQLGVFFTASAKVADRFNRVKTDLPFSDIGKLDFAEGANQLPVYLSIKNPAVLSAKEFRDLMVDLGSPPDKVYGWMRTPEGWAALRDHFINAEGRDGVKILAERNVYSGSGLEEYAADQYVAFNPTQIKSAISNTGAFDSTNPSILESRAAQGKPQGPIWNSPESSRADDVIYTMQDKNIDLKRVQQAIKEAVGEIRDDIDAYLQEELFHGRAAKITEEFLDKEVNPLISLMRASNVSMEEMETFLWARHAKERNAQIAKINDEMPDGGSGLTNKQADDLMAGKDVTIGDKTIEGVKPNRKELLSNLAGRVDAITRGNRALLERYSLESADTLNAWDGAYKHYVPLHREDAESHLAGMGTGQGYSVKGSSSKRATGSSRPVENILANLALQRERIITRGEKNRVAQSLYGLAKEMPNADLWEVDVKPTMKTVAFIGGQEQVVDAIDPAFRSKPNVVFARFNGEDRFVVFNEHNERALRMAEALKNLDADDISHLLGEVSRWTRYFASINTQYNPIFGVTNLVRDVQTGLLNLKSTPIAGKQKEMMGHLTHALPAVFKALRADRKGQAAPGSWAQLWEEFQEVGGQTGYRDMFRNSQERAEALQNALDPTWWQKTWWGKAATVGGVLAVPEQAFLDKVGKPLMELLSDYNTMMENGIRLAAYKVALDTGMTQARAASLAKNLTVNFNRKGQAARQVGSLYAFFNASVQGTARMAETLNHGAKPGELLGKAGKQIVYGGLLLGAVQAMLLMAAGFDDEEPPEFVRDRNIIIPTGNGKYVSIPMPLGFHVLPAISRISIEFTAGGFKKPGEHLVHIMDVLLDSFNPIGNAGLSMQTVAPTVLDPIAALTENKDWSGRQIARQDFSKLNPTPGYTRAKDTASSLSRGLAYAFNYLSGGGEYGIGIVSPTPDQIDYLLGQLTGGVGRELGKVLTTGETMATGEDLPPHKIPLVGRFYGDTTGQSSEASKFYGTLEKLSEHRGTLDRMKDARDAEAYREYAKEHPESRLYARAARVQRELASLRKLKRKMIERNADRAKVRQIEDRMRTLMTRFNQSVSEQEGNHR